MKKKLFLTTNLIIFLAFCGCSKANLWNAATISVAEKYNDVKIVKNYPAENYSYAGVRQEIGLVVSDGIPENLFEKINIEIFSESGVQIPCLLKKNFVNKKIIAIPADKLLRGMKYNVKFSHPNLTQFNKKYSFVVSLQPRVLKITPLCRENSESHDDVQPSEPIKIFWNEEMIENDDWDVKVTLTDGETSVENHKLYDKNSTEIEWTREDGRSILTIKPLLTFSSSSTLVQKSKVSVFLQKFKAKYDNSLFLQEWAYENLADTKEYVYLLRRPWEEISIPLENVISPDVNKRSLVMKKCGDSLYLAALYDVGGVWKINLYQLVGLNTLKLVRTIENVSSFNIDLAVTEDNLFLLYRKNHNQFYFFDHQKNKENKVDLSDFAIDPTNIDDLHLSVNSSCLLTSFDYSTISDQKGLYFKMYDLNLNPLDLSSQANYFSAKDFANSFLAHALLPQLNGFWQIASFRTESDAPSGILRLMSNEGIIEDHESVNFTKVKDAVFSQIENPGAANALQPLIVVEEENTNSSFVAAIYDENLKHWSKIGPYNLASISNSLAMKTYDRIAYLVYSSATTVNFLSLQYVVAANTWQWNDFVTHDLARVSSSAGHQVCLEIIERDDNVVAFVAFIDNAPKLIIKNYILK